MEPLPVFPIPNPQPAMQRGEEGERRSRRRDTPTPTNGSHSNAGGGPARGHPSERQRPLFARSFLLNALGLPAAICPEWCVWKQWKSVISHEGEAEARGWDSGSPGGGGEGREAPVQQEPERERPNLQLSLKAECKKGSWKEGRKEDRAFQDHPGRGKRRRESDPQ